MAEFEKYPGGSVGMPAGKPLTFIICAASCDPFSMLESIAGLNSGVLAILCGGNTANGIPPTFKHDTTLYFAQTIFQRFGTFSAD